jgi:hypothetical protein
MRSHAAWDGEFVEHGDGLICVDTARDAYHERSRVNWARR